MTKKDLSNKSQKKEIDEKNEEGSGRNSAGARPKVVMLLVDALREDFVDFDIVLCFQFVDFLDFYFFGDPTYCRNFGWNPFAMMIFRFRVLFS